MDLVDSILIVGQLFISFELRLLDNEFSLGHILDDLLLKRLLIFSNACNLFLKLVTNSLNSLDTGLCLLGLFID